MKVFFVYLILCIALIISLPYHFYLTKLAKTDPKSAWKKGKKYVDGFFKLELFLSGSKVEVRGINNIPKDQPVLFVGNHRSYYDILVSHTVIPTDAGFVAKKEMEKIPFLGMYMKDIGCVFLNRRDIKEAIKTIQIASEMIQKGHSMILFPEGTRNQGDEMLPFKEGGYKIADKAKCPIIPFSLSGTDLLLESAPKIRLKHTKIIVEFSTPISLVGLSPQEKKDKLASIPSIIDGMRKNYTI